MDAVVFDFDGVVCDSMGLHAEAYRRLLQPLGIPVDDRQVFLLEGARSESIIRDLAEAADVPLSSEDVQRLANEKQDMFRSLGAPPLYDGAEQLVLDLQQKVPTAVVTGTRRENLDRLAPRLVSGFGAVISQEKYHHDKPHPEPYSNAAAELGIDPEQCIAVENALRGIQSARAAGYGHVVAIATTLLPEDLATAEPDAIVTDHEALAQHLGAQVI